MHPEDQGLEQGKGIIVDSVTQFRSSLNEFAPLTLKSINLRNVTFLASLERRHTGSPRVLEDGSHPGRL